MEHIRKVLQACNFPPWALNTLQNKFNCKHNGLTNTGNQPNNNNGPNSKHISIVVPYIHGLGERFKRTCNNLGIEGHFKGSITIKPFSWPQRTVRKNFKNRVIYMFKCPHTNCPEECIGESGRTFGQSEGTAQGPIPITSILQDTQ